MSTKELPKRQEVPVEQTWDLQKIYASDQEFEWALKELEARIPAIKSHQGTLKNGASHFLEAIESALEGMRELEKLYSYAHLKNDQDKTNAHYQGLFARTESLATQVSAAMAWLEPEILSLSDTELAAYLSAEPKLAQYQHFLGEITDSREHVLSQAEEELLAGAGDIFGTASKTFSVLNNADLQFPVVENEQGEKVQLSHGVYGQLMESTHRPVREAAFKGLYSVYHQFQNTLATTLSSHVKVHNFTSQARHYSSARAASLANNHIPETVYDNLVAVVKENTPLLQRYVTLRKELLGVDQLHMYDMYTPILGEAPLTYSYPEAKEIALKALAPLGTEYRSIVEEAFANRWIDVVENKGKRSGAYSSGSYDTDPYIMLNWHDSLDQLYTLVHEMGHSVHSYYTRHYQPYVYGDYSIFLAEIASTTNENLLTEYLLATETDPTVRAYVLNRYLDGFKGTVFRQTQFAEFEHHIHVADSQGVPLTSEYLNEYYGQLNADYYGPSVARDAEIALEWARIPHFYYNYYVYQYATGFSAAATLAQNILTSGTPALDKYLTYLKAGSSEYPIEVMKKAGVDMTQPTYLTDAMAVFAKRLTEFEELVHH